MPESATRRLRADRSRQTRDTPANAIIGISGGISQTLQLEAAEGFISQTLQLVAAVGSRKRYNWWQQGWDFDVDKPDRIPLRSVVTVLVSLS